MSSSNGYLSPPASAGSVNAAFLLDENDDSASQNHIVARMPRNFYGDATHELSYGNHLHVTSQNDFDNPWTKSLDEFDAVPVQGTNESITCKCPIIIALQHYHAIILSLRHMKITGLSTIPA